MEKEKEYYNRGTRALGELETGDQVLIWHKEKWQRGEVRQKLARPQSYEVLIHGTGIRLERNRAQIRLLDAEIAGERTKSLNPFPFFQQRTKVPLLASRRVSYGEPDVDQETEDRPTADERNDQEENEEDRNDDTESEGASSDSQSSGDEEEYDTPDSETDEQPEEEDSRYQTRAGRRVQAPNRYSPG